MQTTKTNEPNYFGEILSVMNDEELIRFRRRFENARKHRMAEILTDELEERESLQRSRACPA